ncbi:MAG: outer membrane protein assembly factor BamD, partial [Acinetobacter sp.]|nr:outer membrane protein assembly factor BamD [Acinetobacter sp.]
LAAVERSLWVVEHYPQTPQIPEALATIAYGYGKLGDQATAQQYIDVLKINYPELVKSDGTVNMRAARSEGSFLNRATLGIFGKEGRTHSEQDEAKSAGNDGESRSLTNRLSFGLLDRPKAESAEIEKPAQ